MSDHDRDARFAYRRHVDSKLGLGVHELECIVLNQWLHDAASDAHSHSTRKQQHLAPLNWPSLVVHTTQSSAGAIATTTK